MASFRPGDAGGRRPRPPPCPFLRVPNALAAVSDSGDDRGSNGHGRARAPARKLGAKAGGSDDSGAGGHDVRAAMVPSGRADRGRAAQRTSAPSHDPPRVTPATPPRPPQGARNLSSVLIILRLSYEYPYYE